VTSLTEKQSKDPLKLPKAKDKLQESKKEFEDINEDSKSKLTKTIDDRIETYDGVLENVRIEIIKKIVN
jgi:hypothetical protein